MITWHETILYQVHVRGFTATDPEIPEEMRGTYSGMGHPVAIEYLKKLGITAVELMTIHEFINDKLLGDRD